MRSTGRFLLLAVLPLTATALALRLWYASHYPLNEDELGTLLFTRGSLSACLQAVSSADYTPPLYYIFLVLYRGLVVSTQPLWVRLPSVLASVLTVALCMLATRAMSSRKAWGGAILSGLLGTASLFFLQTSILARSYSFYFFFSAASYWGLATAYREDFPRRSAAMRRLVWVAYLLSLQGLLYTHAYGYLVAIAEVGILCLVPLRGGSPLKQLRVGARVGVLTALGGLAWFPVYLHQIRFAAQQPFKWKLALPGLLDIVHTAWLTANQSKLALVSLGGICLVAVLGGVRGSAEARTAQGLLVVAGLIPVGAFLVSYLVYPSYSHSYLPSAALAVYCVTGHGLDALRQRFGRAWSLVCGTVLGALFLPATITAVLWPPPAREPWPELVQFLDSQARPGDLVLFNGWWLDQCYRAHSRRLDLRLVQMPEPYANPSRADLRVCLSRLDRADRVWLVLMDGTPESTKTIEDYFREKYPRRLGLALGKITLVRYSGTNPGR